MEIWDGHYIKTSYILPLNDDGLKLCVGSSGVTALAWKLAGHMDWLGNQLGAFRYFMNFYSWCFIYKLSFF